MSISLFALHLIMFIFLIPRNYCAKVVNEACFLLKFFFVIGVLFALMFVDNKYMIAYVNFSIIISVFFLIYQSVALIDFAYRMNEKLVREYHNGNRCAGVALIFFSVVLLSLNIWLLVEHFQTFWLSGKQFLHFDLLLNYF